MQAVNRAYDTLVHQIRHDGPADTELAHVALEPRRSHQQSTTPVSANETRIYNSFPFILNIQIKNSLIFCHLELRDLKESYYETLAT